MNYAEITMRSHVDLIDGALKDGKSSIYLHVFGIIAYGLAGLTWFAAGMTLLNEQGRLDFIVLHSLGAFTFLALTAIQILGFNTFRREKARLASERIDVLHRLMGLKETTSYQARLLMLTEMLHQGYLRKRWMGVTIINGIVISVLMALRLFVHEDEFWLRVIMGVGAGVLFAASIVLYAGYRDLAATVSNLTYVINKEKARGNAPQ